MNIWKYSNSILNNRNAISHCINLAPHGKLKIINNELIVIKVRIEGI